jgi:monofunctional biosynthetic peptidoglycan transglycosylase
MRLLVSLWKTFCYAAGTAVLGLAIYEFSFLAQILYWVDHNPATTRIMEARLDALRQKDPKATLEQKWVPYQRISNELKRAIIVAEDAKFVEHDGFDWEGIQRALEKNQRRGRIVAGGSTITQQLAKNLFLSGERSLMRKGQEAILASMLEATMSKWWNGGRTCLAPTRLRGITSASMPPLSIRFRRHAWLRCFRAPAITTAIASLPI